MGHQEHCGEPVMPKPIDPATLPQWEYKVYILPAGKVDNDALLNTHGMDGWEAVGYNGRSVLFKRKFSA